MHSIGRQGPTSHCMRGAARAPLGVKNGIAHGRLGRMRVRNGGLAPGGGRRTGAHSQSGPADRLRRETIFGPAAAHGLPSYLAGPRHSMAATPLPGTRCGAACEHPHAAPLHGLDAAPALPAARGMTRRSFCGKRMHKKLHWPTWRSRAVAAAGLEAMDGVHGDAPLRGRPHLHGRDSRQGVLPSCAERCGQGKWRFLCAPRKPWPGGDGPRRAASPLHSAHLPAGLSPLLRRAPRAVNGQGAGTAQAGVGAMCAGRPSRREPRAPAGGTGQCAPRGTEAGI